MLLEVRICIINFIMLWEDLVISFDTINRLYRHKEKKTSTSQVCVLAKTRNSREPGILTYTRHSMKKNTMTGKQMKRGLK